MLKKFMMVNSKSRVNVQIIGLILFLLCSGVELSAQKVTDTKEVEIQKGEKWWGGTVWDGHLMPFDMDYEVSLYGDNKGNQIQPVLLSNKGRVVWSYAPISYSIDGDQLSVSSYGSPIKVSDAGATLKDAFMYASKNYFPASGDQPDRLLFERPQYNTWIELIYNQNQQDILKYASAIKSNGFPSGVLMIDDNWQEDYGKWNFHASRFEDPKAMVDSLHDMGFKVMLWICPFVSPDSDVYRALAAKGYFVKTPDGGEPIMVRWWNGVSAVLDFTNPGAVEWFDHELQGLQQGYGIDGFKFDAGDTRFYEEEAVCFDGTATPNDHTYAFQQFGLKYPLNEYRATWKMGGQPLAQRLHDKGHSWEDIHKLIPQITLQGLIGYPFNCPDMIGGGEYGSFIDLKEVDQELIVRSAQVHALMPMMQFSVAPWRVLDEEHLAAIKSAIELRESYLPQILSLLDQASQNGEPIVRMMEYEFPGQGLENVSDQFMLGSDVLVAPVLEKGAREREVLLPKGKWSWKGRAYRGGRSVLVEVALEELPVFTKK